MSEELKPCQNNKCGNCYHGLTITSNCWERHDEGPSDCHLYQDKPIESAWEMFRRLLNEETTSYEVSSKMYCRLNIMTAGDVVEETRAIQIMQELEKELSNEN